MAVNPASIDVPLEMTGSAPVVISEVTVSREISRNLSFHYISDFQTKATACPPAVQLPLSPIGPDLAETTKGLTCRLDFCVMNIDIIMKTSKCCY